MLSDELKKLATPSKASDAAVSRRGKEMGFAFPDDYAAFLKSYGGIPFPPGEGRYGIDGAPSTFDSIFGLKDVHTFYASRRDEDNESYQYKFKHCVVATVNGEEILMITHPGDQMGCVYLWDEDRGGLLEDPEDHVDELNELDAGGQIEFLLENEIISELAPSFTEFLSRIQKK